MNRQPTIQLDYTPTNPMTKPPSGWLVLKWPRLAGFEVATDTSMVTRKLTLTQFESGEVITGIANTMTREVTVTMPTGEILKGKFSEQSDFSTSTNGKAYALLKSSKSKLMLELTVSFNEFGHGFGDAHTNDGKNYKVQF